MTHLATVWISRCLVALLALATLSTTAYGQSISNPLIPESTALRHGLTRSWFHRVQMDAGRDRVENITVGDGVLFVQTRRGIISSIDSETGKVHWYRRIGSINRPTTAVGVGPNHVAALNGNTLYVMDRENGNILWQQRTFGAPGAGPAVTRNSVFVPSNGGVMQGYSIHDNQRRPWRYASVGLADVQPYATESSVSWPTEANYFYVADSSSLNPRFRIELGSGVAARPVYIKPYLYVGTLGGHLYKIHEQTGSRAWRLATGSPISSRPLATGELVYVATETGGVFCLSGRVSEEQLTLAESEAGRIDRTATVDGEEIWWAPGVTELLAASPTRLYGRDAAGRMLVLRADNGGLVDTLSAEFSDLTVANDRTDRIFLATHGGLIQCLHEVALTEPVVHANVKAMKKASEEAEAAEAEEEGLGGFEEDDDDGLDDDEDDGGFGDDEFEDDDDF